ncbi:MAG: hypothetical protein ABI488_13130 [Polyangiaceae bacterium]
MRNLARASALLTALFGSSFILESRALAQDTSAPASAAFPNTAASAPPAAAPAPLPNPPNAPPGAAPVAASASNAPAYPAPQQLAYPDPNPPAQYGEPGGAYYGAPPPPPPQAPNDGFKVPDISVRIDPFNLLLEGRLGLELETEVYKFLTVEIVPVFVTTKQPPTLNYATYNSTVSQSSNGIGAISGAAIDAGFWFGRKPLVGNVLRVGLSNYSYKYESKDGNGVSIDSVAHTDREFFVMFGQHSRWGAFTIAGGLGLGYELNKQNRCFDSITGSVTSSCPKDQALLQVDRSGGAYDLNSFLYPFDLLARFSLGVVF